MRTEKANGQATLGGTFDLGSEKPGTSDNTVATSSGGTEGASGAMAWATVWGPGDALVLDGSFTTIGTATSAKLSGHSVWFKGRGYGALGTSVERLTMPGTTTYAIAAEAALGANNPWLWPSEFGVAVGPSFGTNGVGMVAYGQVRMSGEAAGRDRSRFVPESLTLRAGLLAQGRGAVMSGNWSLAEACDGKCDPSNLRGLRKVGLELDVGSVQGSPFTLSAGPTAKVSVGGVDVSASVLGSASRENNTWVPGVSAQLSFTVAGRVK